ncbi:hypothetical protein FLL45_15780 [Aliikangiella marina]|uniref:Uncharacterized protein n=1 Tax=Aliikangiella marina TaxID=1712262 RepID=A0A545T6S1_9GAMM|nr:hypothetical protein [Aliikangiella marina]TQV72924.1 hypothetical protein FLL45_15780 [Aliikangiella marina]
MDWFELAQELEPGLRIGDLDSCLARAIEVIEELPKTPFHKVVELEFTNSLNEVGQYISSFLNKSNESIELKSLYTETNGFDINPDEWYFELFGYASYGGHEDYDWLCEWQTESENRLTLT